MVMEMSVSLEAHNLSQSRDSRQYRVIQASFTHVLYHKRMNGVK